MPVIRKFFILLPSDTPHGPVKGAYALANAIARHRDVALVTLRHGPGAWADLDSCVRRVCLQDSSASFRGQVRRYREMLRQSGGRGSVASISMCLSADVANSFCQREAVTCASVRGNLRVNYQFDYGRIGGVLGAAHLLWLRRLDCVVAMTDAMADQVQGYLGRKPVVIGNFVDEKHLERFRIEKAGDSTLRFVFVGSLSERKRPMLLVGAVSVLRSQGWNVALDIAGEGVLFDALGQQVHAAGLGSCVTLHGFKSRPYELLCNADAMVLPSSSEGASRAVLEALYLGVPCVVCDVDGNAELVKDGVNGALFSDESELPGAMLRAAMLGKSLGNNRPVLTPDTCRQDQAAMSFIRLLESV